MLEIKKVKNLKDRLEAFTRETLAQLSKTADKSISDNLDNIELALGGLERVVQIQQAIKKYLNNPEPYLEQEIEEYLI
jgi:hypothetical protein